MDETHSCHSLDFQRNFNLQTIDFFEHSNNYHRYGVDAYSPEPDGTLETTKPIGTAIVFDVNDDGTQWSFTIRGNSTAMLYSPPTKTYASNENKLSIHTYSRHVWNTQRER